MTILQRINRFYVALFSVLVALSVLVIVVLQGVFGAISKSGEIDEELLGATTPRLDKAKIEEALEAVKSREVPALDL